MAEYIGSRISLISKRDIRYVGTLHEISSENSTVALEQVKSYGTEGRDPENEIPPSDNVYEYIVFRGSDVKDLRIEKEPEKKPVQQPQVPDDPAILGNARPSASATPSSTAPQAPNKQPSRQSPAGPNQQTPQFQNHQHFPSQQNHPQGPGRFNQQPNFPYGYPMPPNQRYGGPPQGFPPYGYPMPYGSPPPAWYPPPGQGFPQSTQAQFYPPPGPFGPPGQPPNQHAPPSKPTPPAVDGNANKERTPGILPAPQQAVEKPAATVKLPSSASTPVPTAVAQDGPPPPTKSKPDVAAALAPPAPLVAKDVPAATQQAPRSGRIVPAVPIVSPAIKSKVPVNGAVPPITSDAAAAIAAPSEILQARPLQPPTKSLEDANRDARAAVAAAMAKLPPSSVAQKKQINGISAIDNLTNKVKEMRTDEHIRSSRQPGTGGYAAGNRGGRGGRGGRPREDSRAKEINLPKDDYDFALANAKFKKEDLVKEAIASGEPLGRPVNATAGNASADISDVGVRRESEASVTIPTAAGYNKTNSFFDNISSESRDRDDKKLGGREFRNEERNKNLETFGQGSVDNGYRGGFRGRGRGRGYRGGGRGGYGASRGRGAPRGAVTAGM